MKRMLKMVSVLLVILALPLTVWADVIYWPADPFFEDHHEACEYHARSYTAAGPNGDVTVYESPESAWEETKISNGSVLWISYTYKDADGIKWGCWESWEENLIGWVPMDYLELIYDGISFDEEYGDQYVKEDGQLDSKYRGQTIYFWDYPGCEASSWHTLSEEEEYLPEYSVLYTDADGRTWGKLSYYMGHRDSWICLDDPTADFDTLYPNGIEETQPAAEPTEAHNAPVQEIVPKENGTVRPAVIGAVAAVVVITAVLLYLLKKKKA